jgi:hypothetical protein
MAEADDRGGLAERIKKARVAAVKLNQATDALNAALKEAEKTIAGLRLGVSASVPMPSSEVEESDSGASLAFKRHRGEWCLVVEEFVEAEASVTTTPLLECSRDDRLEAADLLPELVDALLSETETLIGDVDTKIESVTAFTKRLREAQS